MIVYGVVLDYGMSQYLTETINDKCTPENKLELIISDGNDYAMFGVVLNEESCFIPRPVRDYGGDYGPTADAVMTLDHAMRELMLDDLIPDVYVFEPWRQE